LTGRVPRELSELEKAPSVDAFKLDRLKHFDLNIKSTFKKLTTIEQEKFLYNLDYIFGLKIAPIATLRIEESAMDAGLLYYNSDSMAYKTLSNLASQSLMSFFLDHVKTNLVPIFSRVC